MAKIHHMTLKVAEKAGIILTSEGDDVQAFWPKHNRTLSHRDAKIALGAMQLVQMLTLEYPGVRMEIVNGDFCLFGTKEGADAEPFYTFDNLPTLQEVLDVCADEDVDPNDGEVEQTEDEERGGSIVPEKYRALYAEAGHPDNCGDWLAVVLENTTHDQNGFVGELFRAVLEANGIDVTAAWADPSNSSIFGWSGRFRMTGRNKLETVVAVRGSLILPNGDVLPVPADDLAILRQKRRAAVTKAERAAAKAAPKEEGA
jgi:hypothetical protein